MEKSGRIRESWERNSDDSGNSEGNATKTGLMAPEKGAVSCIYSRAVLCVLRN